MVLVVVVSDGASERSWRRMSLCIYIPSSTGFGSPLSMDAHGGDISTAMRYPDSGALAHGCRRSRSLKEEYKQLPRPRINIKAVGSMQVLLPTPSRAPGFGLLTPREDALHSVAEKGVNDLFGRGCMGNATPPCN